MANAEDFLLDLTVRGAKLKLETHRFLSSAPYVDVRRTWAGRNDTPPEIVAERLQTETDTVTLMHLARDLKPETVTVLVKRKLTGALLEQTMMNLLYCKEDVTLDALKLMKKLDPRGYTKAMKKASSIMISGDEEGLWVDNLDDLWREEYQKLALFLIDELPLDALEDLCQQMPRMAPQEYYDAVFTRITKRFCKEALRVLAVMTDTKPFATLKPSTQNEIRNFLQTEVDENFDKRFEMLEALRWWAEISPPPKNNSLVHDIEDAGTGPSSPVALTPEDPAEKAIEFVNATHLEGWADQTTFLHWARLHPKEIDSKIVASWLEDVKNATQLLTSMIGCATSPSELRQLAPKWAEGYSSYFLSQANTMEEVKKFPLREVIVNYRNIEELFEYIKSLDESLEVFYALSGNYEGTLGEFAEVIEAFKAEKA